MDTYRFTVEIEVKVDAYNKEDAEDAIRDIFGPGSDCGAEVESLKIIQA